MMKSGFFLSILLLPLTSWGQSKVISAREALKLEGQWVIVRDSIYEGAVLNDSTAIYYLGAKANKHPLVILHITRPPMILSHQSDRYIKTLQLGKVVFKGTVFKMQGTPMIIVRSLKEFGIEVPPPH